ncbi:hypothetical protein [Pedobacter aquatilis]|uniref:hypothetical protein n=1 Tax=Pedobacter aquatilis TaxID=351343 RepID=UPI00292E65AC|nr:hypothetical protein [Pedobacter aquatilis]
MKSMLAGAPFNYTSTVNLSSIDTNQMTYNSTWAPGQYLVPMLFIKYFGLNIGESIGVTNFLMSLLGLFGFYYLFLALKFDRTVILTTLLIIVCQRFYSISYSLYNGGETILFGILPWILLVLVSLKYNRVVDFFYFILLCYIGFLSKFSFIIIALALTVFLIIRNLKSIQKVLSSDVIIFAVKHGLVFIVFFAVCYFTFINEGLYNQQTFNFSFSLTNSIFVLAEPLGSILSIDDIYQRLFEFPGYNIPESKLSIIKPVYYLIIALISILSVQKILKLKISQDYKALLVSFLMIFTCVFLIFYNKKDITSSMEMRHFRSVGFLILPGVIDYLKESRKTLFGYVLISTIFVSCLYGITSFLQREIGLQKNSYISDSGFRLAIIDKPTLTFLKQLDKNNTVATLIYLPDAAAALEFNNSRILISQADFEPLQGLQEKHYLGKVPKLYIALQSRFEKNGKQKAILGSFRNYQHFKTIFKNEEFTVFEGLN